MERSSYNFYAESADFLEKMIQENPNNEKLIDAYSKLIDCFSRVEEQSIQEYIQKDNNRLEYDKAYLSQD